MLSDQRMVLSYAQLERQPRANPWVIGSFCSLASVLAYAATKIITVSNQSVSGSHFRHVAHAESVHRIEQSSFKAIVIAAAFGLVMALVAIYRARAPQRHRRRPIALAILLNGLALVLACTAIAFDWPTEKQIAPLGPI
jgi:uncharacterized BrkB/YihY/UPF0761 family membrane protein